MTGVIGAPFNQRTVIKEVGMSDSAIFDNITNLESDGLDGADEGDLDVSKERPSLSLEKQTEV
jgi:hypothetical protein